LIRNIQNRRRSGDRNHAPRSARVADWIIIGISVLNLLFVFGTVLWGNPRPLFGIPLIFRIVLGLGVLSSVLTIGALVYMVPVWKNRYWGIVTKMFYTLVTVAAVGFVWFLNTWNLLGWRY
jgi:hypothetical protein